MADLLYDLLALPRQTEATASDAAVLPREPADPDALAYLEGLAAKPLASLRVEEPQALSQTLQSVLLSLQTLSKQSYRHVLESAQRHGALQTGLHGVAASTSELRMAVPLLDKEVVRFSTTFRPGKTSGKTAGPSSVLSRKPPLSLAARGDTNADSLVRRRRALLLSRNVERLIDVLELPPLLSSAVAAAPVNYGSALDLNSHIRRLHALYPDSPLVQSVATEADESMHATAASLVLSLKAPGLKLAASLRTISWLRRVLPDLESAAAGVTARPDSHVLQPSQTDVVAHERSLGALFLVCRLATLIAMLDALAPLRELADQERVRQAQNLGAGNAWSGGQQTERYLKRYVEIFREQSFAIVSMFRSIFPAASQHESPKPTSASAGLPPGQPPQDAQDDPLEPLPSAMATFPLHLVDMLLQSLRQYLPIVRDHAARDSLLTQVLYCAGSLGRLGGDFGLFLATLDVGGDAEDEWVEIVRRHRQLAGRLESIVGDAKDKGRRSAESAS